MVLCFQGRPVCTCAAAAATACSAAVSTPPSPPPPLSGLPEVFPALCHGFPPLLRLEADCRRPPAGERSGNIGSEAAQVRAPTVPPGSSWSGSFLFLLPPSGPLGLALFSSSFLPLVLMVWLFSLPPLSLWSSWSGSFLFLLPPSGPLGLDLFSSSFIPLVLLVWIYSTLFLL